MSKRSFGDMQSQAKLGTEKYALNCGFSAAKFVSKDHPKAEHSLITCTNRGVGLSERHQLLPWTLDSRWWSRTPEGDTVGPPRRCHPFTTAAIRSRYRPTTECRHRLPSVASSRRVVPGLPSGSRSRFEMTADQTDVCLLQAWWWNRLATIPGVGLKPTFWRGIRTRYSQIMSLVLYPLS